MNLANLKSLFANNGCKKVYIKKLSPNDNSKNQVYLGGSWEILNIFPLSEIIAEEAGDWEKERFKAKLDFAWITEDGEISKAPKSQLILYPKYPEVRFSGFLQGCKKSPSELMANRLEGRILFLSVASNGTVLGYVSSSESVASQEFVALDLPTEHGIFSIINLPTIENNRSILLSQLKRIHNLGWIDSKRLHKSGDILPCNASNCGGYTLEAELGISANGYSEPDFMGWEIKQFGVTKCHLTNSKAITLMTPEPTDGFYKEEGGIAFVLKYGYDDKNGRPDRKNFGGTHFANKKHHLTSLELKLIGFDPEAKKIRNTNGRVTLVDEQGNQAASWSFASLLKHWNKKHNQACYVPSLLDKEESRKYSYCKNVILGIGTDFQLYLNQLALGNVYYDPGIKVENISTKPKLKPRSQFRIKSRHIGALYHKNELVDVTEI